MEKPYRLFGQIRDTGQTGQSDDRWIEQIEQLIMQADRAGHERIAVALRALLASKARAA